VAESAGWEKVPLSTPTTDKQGMKEHGGHEHGGTTMTSTTNGGHEHAGETLE